MSSTFKQALLAAVAAMALVACGAAEFDSDEADATSAGGLYFVRHDDRRCPSPACGGFWMLPNKGGAAQYAASIDWSGAGLDAVTRTALGSALPEELLVRGKLVAASDSAAHGQKIFAASAAWRGLPGVVPGASEKVYSAKAAAGSSSGASSGLVASQAATGSTTNVSRVQVQRASKAFVDQAWLSARVASSGSLAFAKVTTVNKEAVLDASQIYLKLPERAGCPAVREPACPAGQVHTYDRDTRRCLVPTGCAQPGACSHMLPSCTEGYDLVSWATAPRACPAAACDPSWVAGR